MPSLKLEFQDFKEKVITILEEIVKYNWDRDNLIQDRAKSQRILGLIEKLKSEEEGDGKE